MKNNRTVVAENNLNSYVDEEVNIRIGERMGVRVDDLDGSQAFQATLTGFPTNLLDLHFAKSLSNVTTAVAPSSGSVSIQSTNTFDALLMLASLRITLFHDDDTNFLIVMTGTCTDTGASLVFQENFYLTHQVIVQAVADAPKLDAGVELRAAQGESRPFELYPVSVALNDKDGSETFESVK